MIIKYLLIISTVWIVGHLQAQQTEEEIVAWGRIKVDLPSSIPNMLPFGVPPGITVNLTAVDGSYNQTITSGDEYFKDIISTGRFSFTRVPYDVGMRLTVEYDGATGRDSYYSVYTFRRPDLNRLQEIFRKNRALELAGYMGDFIIDIRSGEIRYHNRYE